MQNRTKEKSIKLDQSKLDQIMVQYFYSFLIIF